ncbi:MAG: DUF1186 domain-containing protein [Chloroflexota bacterium]
MSIQEILSAFEPHRPVYQRAAVEAAIAKRDEIIPHLMRILQDVADDPKKYYDDDEGQYFAYIYAAMLLGHLKAEEAHQTLIDAFSIPSPYHYIYDDMVTEDLPQILYRTYDGNIEPLKSMISRRDLDEFVRGAGIHTLVYLLIKDIVDRDEVIPFLIEFLHPDADETDGGFLEMVIEELVLLNVTEALPYIEQTFQSNLIEHFRFENIEEVQAGFNRGPEANLKEIEEDFNRRPLDDIHDSMDWWYSFQPDDDDGFDEVAFWQARQARKLALQEQAFKRRNISARRQKKAKKKKRKAAKAARKKNKRK